LADPNIRMTRRAAGSLPGIAPKADARVDNSRPDLADVTIKRGDRIVAGFKAMRPHQWAKNSLIFVPILLAGKVFDWSSLSATVLAFVAFSLVASGVYVINDLVDLADDREHWTKRHRPLASGVLRISHGVALCSSLFVFGAVFGTRAGGGVLICLLAYVVASVAYSLWLKRIILVDVLTLAGLFTMRLLIGTIAAGAVLSPWLMTVSMFFFLSLSLVKRYTELQRTASEGRMTVLGRSYLTADMPIVLSLGCGSLVASIVVFVLYLTQEAFVAAQLALPKLLWVFPPGVFLIGCRLWLLSGRGDLHDDPVAFLVKDFASLAVLGGLTVIFAVALI
jgi:4-hydroxybenzoate polyprenyltransferase